MKITKEAKNAIMIGGLCSASYLAVYFARNILSAVTPKIVNGDEAMVEYIGVVSSLYFIFYAVGQLINGIIGDKIKAKYMISFGLLLAGATNIVFPYIFHIQNVAKFLYAMTGFFLSMIYAPMTKVVAENTNPIHTVRCSLGYELAALLGSPFAGLVASFLVWQSVFFVGSIALFVMAGLCMIFFIYFERKGIVTYGKYVPTYTQSTQNHSFFSKINILIKHRIIIFSLISIITGVIRTTVVFWLPTYFSQYLGYSQDEAPVIFSVATLLISFSAFIAVFVYERLHRNMDLTILIMFTASALFFLGVYFLKNPVINIIFIVLAVIASNCCASMLWSRYCPSLRDTGMVSSATGYLDFLSYMAAAASSTIFANSVSTIGWGNLILIWMGLMVFGIFIMIPYKKIFNKKWRLR
ncbi:MAG: MFS transporter [Clostridia bacterium]|nr:MFS transporter [Clostridia bacterium]